MTTYVKFIALLTHGIGAQSRLAPSPRPGRVRSPAVIFSPPRPGKGENASGDPAARLCRRRNGGAVLNQYYDEKPYTLSTGGWRPVVTSPKRPARRKTLS